MQLRTFLQYKLQDSHANQEWSRVKCINFHVDNVNHNVEQLCISDAAAPAAETLAATPTTMLTTTVAATTATTATISVVQLCLMVYELRTSEQFFRTCMCYEKLTHVSKLAVPKNGPESGPVFGTVSDTSRAIPFRSGPENGPDFGAGFAQKVAVTQTKNIQAATKTGALLHHLFS